MRSRFPAWLALLALCLQFTASGVSAFHAAERLAPVGGVSDICTSATNEPADHDERHRNSAGRHCPFCVSQAGALPLLAAALSLLFPPATDAADFVADAAEAPPVAPNLRHAFPRAPPFPYV